MDINFAETLKHKSCLNKLVKVNTVDGDYHEGWMKALDPLSGNILLVTLNDDKSKIINSTLIIAASCVSVDVVDTTEISFPDIPVDESNSLSSELKKLSEMKERLIAWIKNHYRLPVKEIENGSFVLCGTVLVSPPYGPGNCKSWNPRSLQKAVEIIKSLPPVEETVESQLESVASKEIPAEETVESQLESVASGKVPAEE